jgi:hypothetical protein
VNPLLAPALAGESVFSADFWQPAISIAANTIKDVLLNMSRPFLS